MGTGLGTFAGRIGGAVVEDAAPLLPCGPTWLVPGLVDNRLGLVWPKLRLLVIGPPVSGGGTYDDC